MLCEKCLPPFYCLDGVFYQNTRYYKNYPAKYMRYNMMMGSFITAKNNWDENENKSHKLI